MMGSSSCILLGASATVHPRNGRPHMSCTSLSLISATFPPAASWITHSCGAPPPLLSSPVQQEKMTRGSGQGRAQESGRRFYLLGCACARRSCGS